MKKFLRLMLVVILGVSSSYNMVIAEQHGILGASVETNKIALKTYENKSLVNLQERTKEDIIEKAKVLKHRGLGWSSISNKYTSDPSTINPYYEGALTEEYLQDGLNSVNMVRYIAGLPDDIELDENYNELCQFGTVVLAANNKLTHYPTKPSDMSDEFFRLGYAATTSSNIGAGHEGLSHFNISCMNDSDSSNIDKLGHRRWLLYPDLKYVGMGSADRFYATRVFDWSRSEEINYDYISWPSKGAFPVEYFDKTQAWSVTLNPQKYMSPLYSEVKVELTRVRDGKKWRLDSSIALSNGSDGNKDYFNVDNAGYGVDNCIIFRPGNLEEIKTDDKFLVKIAGIKNIDGTLATINYQVEIFNIKTNEKPSINGTKDITILAGDNLDLRKGVTAIDKEDGDITSEIYVYESINTMQPGVYYVEYSVYDSDNNYISVTIKVTIRSTDWYNHWGGNYIRKAMGLGWVNRTTEFRPNDSITRAEFLKIINKAYGYTEMASENFNDVYPNDWFYNEVRIAVRAGYISIANSKFRPNESISREEAAAIITTIMKNKDLNLDKIKNYEDYRIVSPWAQSSVEGAVEAGYMGVNVKRLYPISNITRSEAVTMLLRVKGM